MSDEKDADAVPVKYGARVSLMNDGVILVQQTIKSGPGQNDRYVIDSHKERFVDPDDNEALGAAVREAVHGDL